MKMKQQLIWVPEGEDIGATLKLCNVPYNGPVPDRVWTLFKFTDENVKPDLPFDPVHWQTAFLESKIHDWDIIDNVFQYRGRNNGKVWVLFEFDAS